MALGVSFLYTGSALAVEPEVPIRLQVSLLDRVIPYDRNFAVRVHGQLAVAVVVDEGSMDSVRIGALLLGVLSGLDSLGSYPFAVTRVKFAESAGLAEECKRLRAGVVLLTPGLREPITRLASSLAGLRALTVGTLADDAALGTILGFAVRSGKPRVLVNIGQARAQEVDFRADFLRMAEVVK
jgi:hypothetical protein